MHALSCAMLWVLRPICLSLSLRDRRPLPPPHCAAATAEAQCREGPSWGVKCVQAAVFATIFCHGGD